MIMDYYYQSDEDENDVGRTKSKYDPILKFSYTNPNKIVKPSSSRSSSKNYYRSTNSAIDDDYNKYNSYESTISSKSQSTSYLSSKSGYESNTYVENYSTKARGLTAHSCNIHDTEKENLYSRGKDNSIKTTSSNNKQPGYSKQSTYNNNNNNTNNQKAKGISHPHTIDEAKNSSPIMFCERTYQERQEEQRRLLRNNAKNEDFLYNNMTVSMNNRTASLAERKMRDNYTNLRHHNINTVTSVLKIQNYNYGSLDRNITNKSSEKNLYSNNSSSGKHQIKQHNILYTSAKEVELQDADMSSESPIDFQSRRARFEGNTSNALAKASTKSYADISNINQTTNKLTSAVHNCPDTNMRNVQNKNVSRTYQEEEISSSRNNSTAITNLKTKIVETSSRISQWSTNSSKITDGKKNNPSPSRNNLHVQNNTRSNVISTGNTEPERSRFSQFYTDKKTGNTVEVVLDRSESYEYVDSNSMTVKQAHVPLRSRTVEPLQNNQGVKRCSSLDSHIPAKRRYNKTVADMVRMFEEMEQRHEQESSAEYLRQNYRQTRAEVVEDRSTSMSEEYTDTRSYALKQSSKTGSKSEPNAIGKMIEHSQKYLKSLSKPSIKFYRRTSEKRSNEQEPYPENFVHLDDPPEFEKCGTYKNIPFQENAYNNSYQNSYEPSVPNNIGSESNLRRYEAYHSLEKNYSHDQNNSALKTYNFSRPRTPSPRTIRNDLGYVSSMNQNKSSVTTTTTFTNISQNTVMNKYDTTSPYFRGHVNFNNYSKPFSNVGSEKSVHDSSGNDNNKKYYVTSTVTSSRTHPIPLADGNTNTGNEASKIRTESISKISSVKSGSQQLSSTNESATATTRKHMQSSSGGVNVNNRPVPSFTVSSDYNSNVRERSRSADTCEMTSKLTRVSKVSSSELNINWRVLSPEPAPHFYRLTSDARQQSQSYYVNSDQRLLNIFFGRLIEQHKNDNKEVLNKRNMIENSLDKYPSSKKNNEGGSYLHFDIKKSESISDFQQMNKKTTDFSTISEVANTEKRRIKKYPRENLAEISNLSHTNIISSSTRNIPEHHTSNQSLASSTTSRTCYGNDRSRPIYGTIPQIIVESPPSHRPVPFSTSNLSTSEQQTTFSSRSKISSISKKTESAESQASYSVQQSTVTNFSKTSCNTTQKTESKSYYKTEKKVIESDMRNSYSQRYYRDHTQQTSPTRKLTQESNSAKGNVTQTPSYSTSYSTTINSSVNQEFTNKNNQIKHTTVDNLSRSSCSSASLVKDSVEMQGVTSHPVSLQCNAGINVQTLTKSSTTSTNLGRNTPLSESSVLRFIINNREGGVSGIEYRTQLYLQSLEADSSFPVRYNTEPIPVVKRVRQDRRI